MAEIEDLRMRVTQLSAINKNLGQSIDVQTQEIVKLRNDREQLSLIRNLLNAMPISLETLRWQILIGYGFTPIATKICFNIDLGPLKDSDAFNVDGLAGPTFVRLGLTKPRLAALH